MRIKDFQKTFFFFLPFLAALSCSDIKNEEPCGEIACTEEFVSLTISIKNAIGEPVQLDSYSAVLSETNKDIASELADFDKDSFGENGIYVIFNDRYVKEFENKSTSLQFRGIKDAQEIVSAKFEVGADCCHVKLISGDRDIVIP
ncbi:hypothetical protein [Maribacter sp. 2304DJ31-5]|uniref:hypothetical protein n=1 Tax=Maribacter sp. 2304DJ31-5 TaxID=3386273 RepID=UPI0039BD7E73